MALRRFRSCITKLQIAANCRSFVRLYSSTYKSKYSIENIYPNSDPNFLRKVEFKHTYSNDTDEEFTGYIPLVRPEVTSSRVSSDPRVGTTTENIGVDRGSDFNQIANKYDISIKAVRGSGPGGQNVNKVSSKVEVRFHVESATWIPEWIKENLIENEKGRITKDGYLVVTSEKTRTQMLNQADCLDKVREMIYNSAKKPVEMTKEYKKVVAKRLAKANMERLQRKRADSLKKQNRRSE